MKQRVLINFSFGSSSSSISISGEVDDATECQLAKWSPVGRSLVAVVQNDLYYIQDVSVRGQAKRLTTTGKPGLIFNGVPDWLYEGKYPKNELHFLTG